MGTSIRRRSLAVWFHLFLRSVSLFQLVEVSVAGVQSSLGGSSDGEELRSLGAVEADDDGSCDEEPESSLSEAELHQRDPYLQEMRYNVDDDNNETFWAYVQPGAGSFYRPVKTHEKRTKTARHTGLAGKFINMSNRTVYLFWESSKGSAQTVHMKTLVPFAVGGTATYIGHWFVLATRKQQGKLDPSTILARFQIEHSVNAYDPLWVENDPRATQTNLAYLSPEHQALYKQWRETLDFNEKYKGFTGREYLANYLRSPPTHFMWNADYFGQEHWVTSRETHFVGDLPPDLNPVSLRGGPQSGRVLKPRDPRLLAEHRDPTQQGILNMTLRVVSCAPRAFEIDGFLSETEIHHVLEIAAGVKLARSTVGDGSGEGGGNRAESTTRTSRNSWVKRERTPVIDAIYRRAADLMKIDEAMFRRRQKGEFDDKPYKGSMAEALQLVHYDPGQQYTPHHDFGYTALNTEQGTRFATLLLYLNEGMTGGETAFPRWVNAESSAQLKVTPKMGKAVLFYSQLPDGNLDDLSLHTALPVKTGEKWLINLWVWDPVYKKNKK